MELVCGTEFHSSKSAVSFFFFKIRERIVPAFLKKKKNLQYTVLVEIRDAFMHAKSIMVAAITPRYMAGCRRWLLAKW